MDIKAKVERLSEIKDEMQSLMSEAEQLVRGTSEETRARQYWRAHIAIALGNDHGYLSRGMCTMQDTIDSLAEYEYEG